MGEIREPSVAGMNLDGWMTSVDGDFCPDCWKIHLDSLKGKGADIEAYLRDAARTATVQGKREHGSVPQCDKCYKFAE